MIQMEKLLNFRESNAEEDSLIAEHFYRMWRDNEVPAEAIRDDWREQTIQFMSHARKELSYKAFVAEIDGLVVGSVGCQLFAGLYPHILTNQYRKYGYIWGVYVEPPCRAQGLGKKLTSVAQEYLKSLACTRIILHASPSGKPIYYSLGFSESNEMRIDLK
jgi:ribosomal protein S18 acetylase RimI-like enzyme